MYCPACFQPNPADATQCQKCQTLTAHFRERVFIGKQFVLLWADDAHPLAVSVDDKVQAFRAPTALALHAHTVGFGDEAPADPKTFEPLPTQRPLPLAQLRLGAVVTDRKIYRPGDAAQLFIVVPAAGGQEATLEIKLSGQKIYETKVALNAEGLALHAYSDVKEGEYQAEVSVAGQMVDCAFSAADFALSPLIATLEAHEFADRRLRFTFKVLVLAALYTGPVEFGLQCGVCGDRIVATAQAEVKDGVVQGEFDISGHGGPFHVQLATPLGHTASIAFPGSGAQEREHIRLNPLGQTMEMGLLPWAGAQPVRGFYLGKGEMNLTPVLLENAHSARGVLQAASDLAYLQVWVLNPRTLATTRVERASVKRGETVEFDVDAPYTVFTVAAFAGAKAQPFEGWGVVVKPMATTAKLVTPKAAQPSQTIDVEVVLEGERNTALCWLLAYDVRLEHESFLPKLAKQMYFHLQGTTSGLAVDGILPGTDARWRPLVQEGVRGLDLDDGFAGAVAAEAPASFAAMDAMPAPSPVMAPAGMAPPSPKPPPKAKKLTKTASLRSDAKVDVDEEVSVAIVTPTRMDFPELIFSELLYVEGHAARTLQLGDQIGTWRVRAYVCQGLDFHELTADVPADKPLYAELDLPAIATQGDVLQAAVNYFTREPAELVIATPQGETRVQVNGAGQAPVAVYGPGKYVVAIRSAAHNDESQREVGWPGVQKVIASRLLLLDKGQTAQGERVVVYASMGGVLRETIKALVGYPFGCAEQTSTALYGLAIAYRGMSTGVVGGDLATTQGRILAGLQRMHTFLHKNGQFSLWAGGNPNLDVTAKVTHRLAGLRGLPFPQAEALLTNASAALRKAKHKDNALLPLGAEFGGPLKTPEDAVAYYFAGNGQRDAALKLLRDNVQHEGGRAYWQAASAWGGNLEVTADGARVMYDLNDPLFRPAFAYVTSQLINGMLYTTPDTRALVELLAVLKFDPATRAVIDGQEVALGDTTIGQKVEALSDNLIVRVDETIELNYLEPRADFKFAVKPSKTQMRVGERIQITITPKEQSLAPLARLFLPGNLALLKAGANAQTAYLPIESKELTVDAVAIRPGRSQLHVSVHDMYDAGKVGTMPGLEIIVDS